MLWFKDLLYVTRCRGRDAIHFSIIKLEAGGRVGDGRGVMWHVIQRGDNEPCLIPSPYRRHLPLWLSFICTNDDPAGSPSLFLMKTCVFHQPLCLSCSVSHLLLIHFFISLSSVLVFWMHSFQSWSAQSKVKIPLVHQLMTLTKGQKEKKKEKQGLQLWIMMSSQLQLIRRNDGKVLASVHLRVVSVWNDGKS